MCCAFIERAGERGSPRGAKRGGVRREGGMSLTRGKEGHGRDDDYSEHFMVGERLAMKV